MTTPAPLDQKVRQLDNDVQALYELIYQIATTQKRHTNRLNEITQDVAALGTRLDSIETQVEALTSEVGSLTSEVGSVKTEVGSVRTEVASHTRKLDRILELLEG